jgi:hypothetical protein
MSTCLENGCGGLTSKKNQVGLAEKVRKQQEKD